MDKIQAKNELLERLKKSPKFGKYAGVVVPATLRLSAQLNENDLSFTAKKTEGAYKTDIKLRDGDVFFFNLIALGWTKTTASNAGKDPVFFYPDAIAEPNWQEIETLYNGKLQLVEGEIDVKLPPMSTTPFKAVPQTQYSVTGDPATVVTLPSYQEPFVYTAVGIGMSGAKDYAFKLALGQGTKANITTHRAVLLLDGFIIPGAANAVTVTNA